MGHAASGSASGVVGLHDGQAPGQISDPFGLTTALRILYDQRYGTRLCLELAVGGDRDDSGERRKPDEGRRTHERCMLAHGKRLGAVLVRARRVPEDVKGPR